MKIRNKKTVYIVVLALLLAAILTLLIVWAVRRSSAQTVTEPAVAPPASEPEIKVVYKEKEVEKLVEVEKVITGDIIQDGLNDMGFLVTEEYWFTEVMSFSSVKNILGFDWGITESNFLASYDGSVTAGVDFTAIKIVKDETQMTVTVTVPAAVIQNVTVDNDSFVLYSEKEGLGNPISLEDYNISVITLKEGASQKAIERGVLERADENAERLIWDFISGLVDPSQYTITYQTA